MVTSRRTRSPIAWLLVIAAAAALSACPESRRIDPDGDGDADGDADGDGDSDPDGDGWGFVTEIHAPQPTRVDLLFVIDNSSSMAAEQEVLTAQMEIMARELLAPTGDAPAVDDLHVGVVSTDMGTHGYTVQTCVEPSHGDGGELWNIGRLDGCQPEYDAPDCEGASCPWLTHSPSYPDLGEDPSNPPIWDDFRCIARLGTSGCGFEQPLEAAYQALVVNTRPGEANEGFLRDDSLLAVVFVTDEDDCSTPYPEMFNPTRDDLGPLNLRCALQETELYPIERYREAFIDLRGGDEDRVVVSVIAGVPVDGSWSPGDPLERLRELSQINPENPNELLPSCSTAMGLAYPPVRLAELAYSFGNNGVLESICRGDWSMALQAISRHIQNRLPPSCLLTFDEIPLPGECRVVAINPHDEPCQDLATGAGPDRIAGSQVDLGVYDGRRRCEILPADYDLDGCPDGGRACDGSLDDGLQGWYIDPDSRECPYGELRFTAGALPEPTQDVALECLVD